MITVSSTVEGILNGNSYEVKSRLLSTYGDLVLAEDIPAVDVIEENDFGLQVPKRLTFNVPVEDDLGNNWVPLAYDSPLGTYGQRIFAQIGIGSQNTSTEWINRGIFLIQSVSTEGHTLNVECVSLMQLVDEAELAAEYQPKVNATLGSILRALLEPGITVDLTTAPTDRVAPTSISWSDNRLDNVFAVLDAWPARGYVTTAGVFKVTPVLADATAGEVVYSFTDGTLGTVMEYTTSITREGAFNGVVAKGAFPETDATKAGQEIISTLLDNDQNSPYRTGGPFSPYLVPYGYASSLLTTLAMVQKAAQTRLATLRKQASRTVRASAVPHPALELGDAVTVTSARLGLTDALGRIDALTLPHQAGGGNMGVTVRLND